jgi:hypothetical protein
VHTPLWQAGDVVLLYSLQILGFGLLVASAWATTVSDDVSTRVAWVNLGVVGLLVSGTGTAFWLMAGRRAVGTRRAWLLVVSDVDAAPEYAPRPADRATPAGLVAVADGTRYHRADCALVAGKAVVEQARTRHTRAGRQPCGVCRP